jgi:phosphate-selective porin
MANKSLKWLALLGGVTLGSATLAVAQDSGALLDALVRKGVLNDQEAEDIRADLTRDFASSNIFASPGGKSVSKIAISGRIQVQYDGLSTDNSGVGGPANADPASVNHFFLRRVYLGAKADLGPDFSGNFVYDFAGARFDAAVIEWKANTDLTLGAGLRKVDFGYEERTSSTRLKAIERSGVTRYFVEDNNGRRLGAGAHRVGVFANGTAGNFFYGAAVTNPERVAGFAGAAGTGNSANNNFAYWANAGYKGKVGEAAITTGFGLGYLPDQGGRAPAALPAGSPLVAGGVFPGNDMIVGSLYADVNLGKFNISAEYFHAKVENGNNLGALAGNRDVNPTGYYIQPSFMLTEQIELVARYSHVDTDGRGIAVSDGIRNAPSTVSNYDSLTDYYLGATYYFKGSDLRLSAGYTYGKGEDRLTAGGTRESEVSGFRSQLQLLF